MRIPSQLSLALLPALLGSTAAIAAEREQTTVRLVLTAGGYHDALGPVIREQGLILFRDRDGSLRSIHQEEVLETRELALVGTRDSSTPGESGRRVFTNRDLPAVAPAQAGSTTPTPPRRLASPEARVSDTLIVEAVEHDETWWRARAHELHEAIRATELQQGVTYRLFLCAQHRIPLKGEDCYPRPGLRPKVAPHRETPTEKSLARRLRELATELEHQQAQLAALEQAASFGGRAA